jgi:hypothetical protein
MRRQAPTAKWCAFNRSPEYGECNSVGHTSDYAVEFPVLGRRRTTVALPAPASDVGRFPVRLYLARPQTAPPRTSANHRPELRLTRGPDVQMVERPPLFFPFSLLTVMAAHGMRVDEVRGG